MNGASVEIEMENKEFDREEIPPLQSEASLGHSISAAACRATGYPEEISSNERTKDTDLDLDLSPTGYDRGISK